MAVMTHAQIQPATVDYHRLDGADQAYFDKLMEYADITPRTGEYQWLMGEAARVIGIRTPDGGEIAKCGCSCTCPVIFDASHPDAHEVHGPADDHNLPRLQCPECADFHRETA